MSDEKDCIGDNVNRIAVKSDQCVNNVNNVHSDGGKSLFFELFRLIKAAACQTVFCSPIISSHLWLSHLRL